MTRPPFTGFRSVPPLAWHRWGAASVLIHVAVVVAAVLLVRPSPSRSSLIFLSPPETPVEVAMPPVGGTRRGVGPSGGLGAPAPARPVQRAAPRTVGVTDSSLAEGGAETGRFRLLVPRLGDGRLWVRPSADLSPGNITVLNIPVDSAVRVRIQQMVDSFNVARASEPRPSRDWTREIAGAKFGLDSQYIYIAGIKIPAVLLALLPLPQGNIDQAERAAILNAQRQEIQFDAARQAAREDQQRYAEEMRRRKQEERDAERRRRERPPAEQPRP